MDLDPSKLEFRDLRRFVLTSVVPRPIAWVSTRGTDGSLNLAPFSFFNAFSFQPFIVALGIARQDGGVPRDTLRNILETEAFVANLVPGELASEMVETSNDVAYGVNEFEMAGVTPEPALKVDAPRVAESPVSFECVLYDTVDLSESKVHGGRMTPDSHTLLLGEVAHVRLHDDVMDERYAVQSDVLEPLGCMGRGRYSKGGKLFRPARLEDEA